MSKHDKAIKFVQSKQLELSNGLLVLTLRQVADLIKITTGKDTSQKDLVFVQEKYKAILD